MWQPRRMVSSGWRRRRESKAPSLSSGSQDGSASHLNDVATARSGPFDLLGHRHRIDGVGIPLALALHALLAGDLAIAR